MASRAAPRNARTPRVLPPSRRRRPACDPPLRLSHCALQGPYQAVPGRLIVKLRPDIVAAMEDGSHGLRYARQTGLPNAAVYNILDGTDVEAKAAQITALPGRRCGCIHCPWVVRPCMPACW